MDLSETTALDRPGNFDRDENGPAIDGSYVVGLGASADGLDALERFLGALPDEPGMPFVLVQHLSPDFESNLPELLQDLTSLEVERATHGMALECDHLYVVTPGEELLLRDGRLRTEKLPELSRTRHSIDDLFCSVSEEYGYRAVGVLLSGAGSDGMAGLRTIREHGGVTLVQEPSEAGTGSMPRSAVDAGVADFVLPVRKLAERVVDVTGDQNLIGRAGDPGDLEDQQREVLDRILALLRKRQDQDLSRYRRSTLLRRIARRMKVLQIERLEEYLRYLRTHEREIEALFEELTIAVTGFFRDQEVWDALVESVVPQLFEGKTANDQVRAWVPGCSSGEEAYSLAILLCEYASARRNAPEIKVFATDLDSSAVETARRGYYSEEDVAAIPAELREQYVAREGDGYRIAPRVRKRVLFGEHNALDDPPFSKLDLVSCRNVMIYLDAEGQEQLLQLMHYALEGDGYLVLGASESAVEADGLFDPYDEQHRIYRAAPNDTLEVFVPETPFGLEGVGIESVEVQAHGTESFDPRAYHRQQLIDEHVPSSILVDERLQLLHSSGDVGPYLSVPPGEPTQSVLEMMSDEMRPRVRTVVSEALRAGEDTVVRRMPFEVGPEPNERNVVRARRLEPEARTEPVVELVFETETLEDDAIAERTESLDRGSDGEGETLVDKLESELDRMRERLESTSERYEQTNCRLRASNEELVSMNEELQSAAEELETSREELESTNRELSEVNEQLNEKIAELDEVNSDLKNLLRSTEVGTIFLNRDFEVERFTEPATAYVNLLESDIGRPIEHVTHRLDVDALIVDAQRVLEELETIEREVSTEDGQKHLLFRALPYVTIDNEVDGVVLTFVDITRRKEIREQLARSETRFRTVFDSAGDPMFVYEIDADGSAHSFAEVNERAADKTGFDAGELVELSICEVLGGEDFDCEEHLQALVRNGEVSGEALLRTAGRRQPIPCEYSARRMQLDDKNVVVEVVRDITDRKRYERALLESRERAEELAELRSMFLSTLSHDVRSPLTGILAMTHVLRKKLEGEEFEYVERIERSAEQLRSILDSILRMASVETNKAVASPEQFELVGHVREVLEVHEARAQRSGLTLEYQAPAHPLEVTLDPQFVTQIVNNLVENAIKYTEQGGVRVGLEAESDRVRIDVVDTGVGIPEQEREEIFKRFEQSHRTGDNQNSVGLGLAITELLVDSMDGDIDLESTPEEGSCFTIVLPRRIDVEERRHLSLG